MKAQGLDESPRRNSKIRATAWLLALVALAMYAASFIMMAVRNSGGY